MEPNEQNVNENVQVNNEEKSNKKDKSKYLHPAIGYGVSGGALALAIGIALIVLLPLL